MGRIGKAGGQTLMMDRRGKSDRSVVPEKAPNTSRELRVEAVEGRGLTKGNARQQNTSRTQRRNQGVSHALDRVRKVARTDRKARFTSLFHHITLDQLRQAFHELKRKASPGVDGMTWEQYAKGLEGNLEELHERLRRGAYRAKPSRRAYIAKADGRQRPLGIAALEDKIVQRAAVAVLNAVYEEDFLGFSYGFRPGQRQHDALDALATGILRKKVNWVLDADIRGFFDAISHEWLVKFVEHRIADPKMLRLIRKWLRAGVLEDGEWSETVQGTPQGATASPLLANIYLHYVFDLWIQQWRMKQEVGDVIVVRFADDFIVGFQNRTEAESFLDDLRKRLQRFGLELHPSKTRLIRFGKNAESNQRERGKGKPETFDFLGLTHICGRTRTGKFLLHRRTMGKRLRTKLREIKEETHRRRHSPIPEQGAWLGSVVRGFFAYHAVPTNIHSLAAFRTQVGRHWCRALRRRSQRHRVTWARMTRLEERWLPRARISHPWPEQRLDARTRGRSPVR